jgi:hypothetical protein
VPSWRRPVAALIVVVLLVGVGYVVSQRGSSAAAPTRTTRSTTTSTTALAVATTSAPAPAPTTTATPGPTATVTISAVGDTIPGNTPMLPPNAATYFSAVRDELRGDAQIVFANLEGTFTDADGGKCDGAAPGTCYAFRLPPSHAANFAAAGFTVLNNANNHSFDFGPAGQADTVSAIHGAGMAQTGLPGQVTVVEAGPVRVGMVGFATYPYAASFLEEPRALALVAKAKQQSDVVVVYMHAGAEGVDAQHVTGQDETYLGEDRGNPQSFAHKAIDAGASLVIASGPHVLRGMEFYRGHLIAYSLGNFAGYGNFAGGGVLDLSAILNVTVTATGEFQSGRLIAVTLTGKGQPKPGGGARALIAQLSSEDFGPAAAQLAADGTISPP